jgi:hypothetical protein
MISPNNVQGNAPNYARCRSIGRNYDMRIDESVRDCHYFSRSATDTPSQKIDGAPCGKLAK